MATIVTKARGDDADFVICEVHGLDLVYRKTRTGALQLVLPKSHGLRLHVMLELHSSLYSAHLGVQKTIAACSNASGGLSCLSMLQHLSRDARFASASKMSTPCRLASCNRCQNANSFARMKIPVVDN